MSSAARLGARRSAGPTYEPVAGLRASLARSPRPIARAGSFERLLVGVAPEQALVGALVDAAHAAPRVALTERHKRERRAGLAVGR